MPKQNGPVYYTGTVGDACFYKMDGEYYVRRKSSLSGKRVKNAPSFELTRVYAALLAQASKLAAVVYRPLPREQKHLALYRKMTGEALRLLKEGLAVEVINKHLEEYITPKVMKAATAVRKRPTAKELLKRMNISGMLSAGPQYKGIKLSAENLHFALPKHLRVYVTPDGGLEVRLTNRLRTKAGSELVAME